MATEAMHPQTAGRVRPANPGSDRIFFSAMIVALWATVLFGFAKTYFMAGMVRAPLPNALIHIHGAAFTLWMVLLVVQEAFIAGRKIAWHMQLGLVGFGLAVAMVALGLMAAVDQLRRGSAPPGLDPLTFFVIPLSAIGLFAVLVFFAWRARRRAAAHKRLILIATIGLMDAAVGRWPVPFLQVNPKAQDLVILAFLLAVVFYDAISQRKVLKVTIWASLLIVVVHVVRVPIGFTPAWHAFATFMGGKG
jgi:hypothetical protein